MDLQSMGKAARAAARQLARVTTGQKNAALETLADALWAARNDIQAANREDVRAGQENGLSPALVDRLLIDENRLRGIVSDLRHVIELPDPVGEIFDAETLPNGLRVRKQHVPLGVIAVIYEARPNVTVDVAGLCLKSGNAVILRGGSEAQQTNQALVNAIRGALARTKLPGDAVQFIDDPDRALVMELLQMNDYVDMLIPRGGASLHQFCRDHSRIPVITGGIGICHLYVDESADLPAALDVVRNAKIQRPTVCNALDTVLVHCSAAAEFLSMVVKRLAQDGVTFRAEPRALEALGGAAGASVQPAGPEDFDTEWLSLVLGLKVVDGLEEAVEHITQHSTGHSDGILTRSNENASRFVAEVDSAAVYVNASTRFTDGAQMGLGAEIAISTQRLHARGPMALRELTTYKWVIEGDYHYRK